MGYLATYDTEYLAVKREFILKVDGNRPILYSLDYINTHIYYLTPIEGLALSLLDGRKPFSVVKAMFRAMFPSGESTALAEALESADQRVRLMPSQTGIGRDGLFDISAAPLDLAQAFDSREFVISPNDHAARMSDPRTALRLETPILIYTIFTHRCITNCAYCYADRSTSREMPLSRWREIIREMRHLDIWLGCPDNGDTFARKDGVELLECLLEYEMHFLLSTKAHVSREDVGRLVDAGFKNKVRGEIERRVQMSVDAVDPAVASRLLNIRFPRVEGYRETLENFLAFGIMPKIKAVITGLNYDQPKAIVDYFYPAGAREFHFVRYRRTFHRHTDDLFVGKNCYPILRQQFDEIRSQYPDVEITENLTMKEGDGEGLTRERIRDLWDHRLGCGGGWSALGIAPDGNAFLCEQMKMAEPFYVGNAAEQSIAEIWKGERLRRFIYPEREAFVGKVCEHCGEFEKCMWEKGRCYRDAYFSFGSIYEQPPLCPYNPRLGLRAS